MSSIRALVLTEAGLGATGGRGRAHKSKLVAWRTEDLRNTPAFRNSRKHKQTVRSGPPTPVPVTPTRAGPLVPRSFTRPETGVDLSSSPNNRSHLFFNADSPGVQDVCGLHLKAERASAQHSGSCSSQSTGSGGRTLT